MAKKLSFIDYSEHFDPEKVIDVADGYKKTKDSEFDPRGIYSEEIFGNYFSEDNDITKRGWIDLAHPLINPIFYIMMKQKKLIKEEDENNLMEIIKILQENPRLFLEEKRNSKNSLLIDFLYKNSKYMIINQYPIFSHKLRPVTVVSGAKPTLIYDKVNNYFSILIEYNNNIKDSLSEKNYDNNDFIKAMQDKVNTIAQFIMNNVLGKKYGVLRKEVLGMRINHCSRCVITPLTGNYNIDDISIPYVVAVELYKYQIINMLSKIKGINYNQALRIHELAQIKFNPEVYSILNNMVKNTKGGLKVLLGRNPKVGTIGVTL